MSAAVKDAITAALRTVIDPSQKRDVVSLGFVQKVAYCDGVAAVSLGIPANLLSPQLQQHLTDDIRATLLGISGVKTVNCEFIAIAPRNTNSMPGVRHVVAVGAGKGGVGKSTVAVLLAVGLQRLGYKVGLLDADVYGPSLPKLTGTETLQPEVEAATGALIPPMRDGIPIMSMGHLVPPDQAIVWRGPMAQKYVKEFIDRGKWGELDYLIVDLPPGTGDIPLTLAQSIPLTGAVIVCTPQDVAMLDAVKAIRMYEKLGVIPLGIVENMSFYVCPQCGHRAEIFSHGGCEEASQQLDIPFLGNIPINIDIRIHSDAGRMHDNFTRTEPEVVAALEHVVRQLVEQVAIRSGEQLPVPTLNITG
ncbi:MAG: P-loop NTPase [Phycisphaerae bacterium]